MASIGLVGNVSTLVCDSTDGGRLTDWLRSDWLETTMLLRAQNKYRHIAYRLASIGLVGNATGTVIGSNLSERLTDWLRSDWLETVSNRAKNDLCNNRLTDWLRSDWLETNTQ